VGDRDDVSRRECRAELVCEVPRARVEVRLEENEDPAIVPNGSDVGGELSRMVRVAVDDLDAARLSARLEPTGRTAELTEHTCGVVSRVAGQLDRRQRDSRVVPVVLAESCQLEIDRPELVAAYAFRGRQEPVDEEGL